MIIEVEHNQNIIDVVMKYFGTPTGIKYLLKDNPTLSIDSNLVVGQELVIDESKFVLQAPNVAEKIAVIVSNDSTVKHNQNIIDIAIQLYGSVKGLKDLLVDNPTIGINDSIGPGVELNVDYNKVVNKGLLKYYKNQGHIVSTGDKRLTGIGYWYIEVDNIVQ